MAAVTDKTHVLQVLLDVQKLAGELFDEIEAEGVEVTMERILKMATVVNELSAVHRGFVQYYVLSGKAGDDMLAQLREQFAAKPIDKWADCP